MLNSSTPNGIQFNISVLAIIFSLLDYEEDLAVCTNLNQAQYITVNVTEN